MLAGVGSSEVWLVIGGEPREPGYRVEDRTWEARRVRSSVRSG